jgi:hypothetical protein
MSLSGTSGTSTPLPRQPLIYNLPDYQIRKLTYSSGGIGIGQDLLPNLLEGRRVSNFDTLLLEESNRLVERPILVSGFILSK